MNITAEMIQQSELRGLIRGRKHGKPKPEYLCNSIGITFVQRATLQVPRVYHQLQCSSVEPALALLHHRFAVARCPAACLAHLELHFKTPFLGHPYDFPRLERKVCEALPTLDSGHTEVNAKIQISRKL